jgi:ATP-dependent Lon protease
MAAEFTGSPEFPVLLLRRQVAFPRVVVRVLVGRKQSLALLKHLQKQGKVGQKEPSFAAVTLKEKDGAGDSAGNEETTESDQEDAYDVGVAVRLLRITRHSQSRNTYLVLLQGVALVKIGKMELSKENFYKAGCEPLERSVSFGKEDTDTKELSVTLRTVAADMMDKLDPQVSVLAKGNLDLSQMSVSLLTDLLAAHSGIETEVAQKILETPALLTRVNLVIEAVAKVREVLKLNNDIASSVKSETVRMI